MPCPVHLHTRWQMWDQDQPYSLYCRCFSLQYRTLACLPSYTMYFFIWLTKIKESWEMNPVLVKEWNFKVVCKTQGKIWTWHLVSLIQSCKSIGCLFSCCWVWRSSIKNFFHPEIRMSGKKKEDTKGSIRSNSPVPVQPQCKGTNVREQTKGKGRKPLVLSHPTQDTAHAPLPQPNPIATEASTAR